MIRFILVAIFLLIYLIVSLFVMLFALITGKFSMDKRNRMMNTWIVFGFKCVIFICGVKLEVNGRENMLKDTAVMYICNHRSLFDIVVTYSLMKEPTGYLSKIEMKKAPIISWLMTMGNSVFVQRGNPRESAKSILECISKVKSGISMYVFPEGTRTRDGNLLPFKTGCFKIPQKAKCPIVPMGLIGTEEIIKKRFWLIKPGKIIINIGEPIYTDKMTKEDFAALPEDSREVVKNLIPTNL